MTRRTDLLDELADLRADDARPRVDTPRIDTTRNRVDATGKLLAKSLDDLEVLHVLAYNRHAARREAVVAGGDRDYALDNHGDPRARTAYRQLALATLDVCDILAEASHGVAQMFTDGADDQRRRGGTTITVVELATALEAKARRAARGEFTPRLVVPQPDADKVAKVTVESLAAENKRLTDENARLKEMLTQPRRRRGWQKA